MGKPAARITDGHNCLADTPNPHSTGPVITGAKTVIIAGRPAARVTDKVLCGAVPDIIATGSATVIIEGQAAARIGDRTMRRGVIIEGCQTVLIGG
jgi:uncharacterized Zn-binding protein involved in type VI secretion